MPKVIEFPGRKRIAEGTLQGDAVCLVCKHRWVAVADAGTVDLECPSCHTHRGVFDYNFEHQDDPHWSCGCGCVHFLVTPRGILCCLCGHYQTFPEF